MVADIVQTVAISGFVGALVGGGFNLAQRAIHERREDIRVRSEVLVGKKVDALVELYSELDECYKTLRKYEAIAANSNLGSDEYQSEVVPAIQSFEDKLNWAEIYLTDEQDEALEHALNQFQNVVRYIERHTKVERYTEEALEATNLYSYEEFDGAKDDAKAALKRELDVALNASGS